MGHWNYRVMKYDVGGFGLCEVYYNEKGDIIGYTDPVVSGDDLDELHSTINLMKSALQKHHDPANILIEGEVKKVFDTVEAKQDAEALQKLLDKEASNDQGAT